MVGKRVATVKRRHQKVLRIILIAALLAAVVFFIKERKDFLIQDAKNSLEAVLSRESDYRVQIGKISGRFLGQIRFENIRVLSPGLSPEEERLVLQIAEISFHYRLLDFLSKKFDSRITVVIQSPEIWWKPRVRLSRQNDFTFLRWMRRWALAQKDIIDIRIINMSLIFQPQQIKLEGINLSFENNKINAEIPLRHLTFGGMDISTVIKASGDFHLGFFGSEDALQGELKTEGTVVNWSPLPEESVFNFYFSQSDFNLTSANVLGGIRISGDVDFQKDYRMIWDIHAENYLLSNLDFILKTSPSKLLPSRVDIDLHFEGNPLAPGVEGRARIYDGYVGKRMFKVMDLFVSGIYPTVKIQNSRLLLPDDSVMKFAEKSVEFRELFRLKTYEQLIGEAQQDTVVWGDWEFRRPRDMKDNPEFLLQRALGDRARLNFRDYKRDETLQNSDESDKVEVGLEYRLAGKNLLKFQVREDEQFLSVEQKVKF